nr:hypothetical protein [Tianweitania sediminis]
MTQQPRSGKTREERVAEQLRANLARRKEQARSRRKGEADGRPDGVAVSGAGADQDGPAPAPGPGSRKPVP